MIRLDMSEYQTQDSIKRLLGSLPGEEYAPSEFIEKVRENPFSLILLDEFEKAHPRILDTFLQVFEDARLTDNLGRTTSFVNNIIIATSNAGSEFVRERLRAGKGAEEIKGELLEYLQRNGIFRPELLNRFDDVIVFNALGERETREVTRLILEKNLKALEEKGILVDFDEKIVEKIVKEGFTPEFGARSIRRYVEKNIEDFLARMILEGKIQKGEKKTLSVDEQGEITVK
jgi:ATP-dependent Clp protease ATP-binding subunit ClpA